MTPHPSPSRPPIASPTAAGCSQPTDCRGGVTVRVAACFAAAGTVIARPSVTTAGLPAWTPGRLSVSTRINDPACADPARLLSASYRTPAGFPFGGGGADTLRAAAPAGWPTVLEVFGTRVVTRATGRDGTVGAVAAASTTRGASATGAGAAEGPAGAGSAVGCAGAAGAPASTAVAGCVGATVTGAAGGGTGGGATVRGGRSVSGST